MNVQHRVNQLDECVNNYVEDVSIWNDSCVLRAFSNGCGVFATRDIQPNELLFSDTAMIVGPSGDKNEPIVCVICFEKLENDVSSFLCSEKCGLVLCGKIECETKHKIECKLLRAWKPTKPDEFSFVIAKALLVLRALFLSDDHRKLIDLMQKNYNEYEKEIFFDKEFVNFPADDDTVTFLRATSAAMNTNAFKVLYRSSYTGNVCVRAFYPIMSLINHHCLPNSRHDIDDKFVCRIVASRPIKKDEQIFISYSQMLWGTNTRRMHLMVSKQFFCACSRCSDPTENATNLLAMRCQDKTCNGFLLPLDPTNFKSDAQCTECQQICEWKRFLQIQEMFAKITKNFLSSKFTLSELKHFIEARLYKMLPDCNQFVVESKLKAIWKCDTANYEGIMVGKFDHMNYEFCFSNDSPKNLFIVDTLTPSV